MAKKKSTKKSNKNIRSVIFDFVTLVLGGLILGFMALPHMSYKTTVFGKEIVENVSGYQLIKFEDGYDTAVAVVLLLLAIFASLMILFALLKILKDAGIIKNAVFGKVASFGLLVSSLAVVGLVIANCITIPVACKDASLSFGNIASTGVYANWAGPIVNAVVGVGSLITSAFSLRK